MFLFDFTSQHACMPRFADICARDSLRGQALERAMVAEPFESDVDADRFGIYGDGS